MPDPQETNKTRACITGGLRSVASSIPIVASLGTAWSEYDNFKQSERVDEFITSVGERLNTVEGEIVSLHESANQVPDIAETMERCVEAAIREVDANKRKVFSNFYCYFLERPDSTTPEERLNIVYQLEQLTINDINLLIRFARANAPLRGDALTNSIHGAEIPIQCGPPEETARIRNMDPEDYFIETNSQLMHSIVKLESRGLISRSSMQTGIFSATGDMGSDVNQFRQRVWKISIIGRKLVASIHPQNNG